MKASVKMRDGDPPMLRAKLPLSLLTLPAIFKLSLGATHELSLRLATLFDAGPSCRLTYTPSHHSPFSFTLKTGFGLWGSPHAAPLLITARFNLSSHGRSPSFLVRFKPRAGDFGLCKEARSHDLGMEEEFLVKDGVEAGLPRVRVLDRAKTCDSEAEGGLGSSCSFGGDGKGRDTQGAKSGGSGKESPKDYASEKGSSDDGCVMVDVPEKCPQSQQRQEDFVSSSSSSLRGWSIVAHSSLPIGKRAVAKVRWKLGLSANIPESFAKIKDSFSLLGLPLLVMDKVSLEAMQPLKRGEWGQSSRTSVGLLRASPEMEELGRVAALCGLMRRQMHLIQAENEVLKKTMEDMRAGMEYSGGFARPLQGEKLNDFLNQEKELLQAQDFDQQPSKRNGFAGGSPSDRKVDRKGTQVIETRVRGEKSKQDPPIEIGREVPSSAKAVRGKTSKQDPPIEIKREVPSSAKGVKGETRKQDPPIEIKREVPSSAKGVRGETRKQDPPIEIKREVPSSAKAANDKATGASSQVSSAKITEELQKAIASATGS